MGLTEPSPMAVARESLHAAVAVALTVDMPAETITALVTERIRFLTATNRREDA